MQATKTNNTILVPTDFSSVATNALDHAVAIAKKYGNEILLVHIVETSFFGSVLGSKSSAEGLIGQMLQDKLNEVCNTITQTKGVKASGIIKEGRIYKVILEIANEMELDSIVMGTNGAEGLKQIMGSNSSKVIAQSPVPVVVVKEKKIGEEGYKNIVFPVDLTIESKQKTMWAIHLAKKFDSIIHIIGEHENDEFLRKKLLANLRSIEDVLTKNNVKFITRVLDDAKYPKRFYADTIQYAEEENADLIMIMTQQEKGGFSEYLIGSYAQQIVNHHSSTPVMCIVPRDTGLIPIGWTMG